MKLLDAHTAHEILEDIAVEISTGFSKLEKNSPDAEIYRNRYLAIRKAQDVLSEEQHCKSGRWVKKPWKVLGCVLRYDTVCSECGFDAPEFTAGGGSTVLTKFCHNCGAKMENGA